MESKRHKAASLRKYEAYFHVINEKIEEHRIREENTYNMDEKGFIISVLHKQHRVFSREAYESKRVTQGSHDGNREWVSLLAAICADGSSLPPALIWPAESNNIQNTWVADLNRNTHVYSARSPTGWSNDDAALGWLSQVFDRHTKEKANGR